MLCSCGDPLADVADGLGPALLRSDTAIEVDPGPTTLDGPLIGARTVGAEDDEGLEDGNRTDEGGATGASRCIRGATGMPGIETGARPLGGYGTMPMCDCSYADTRGSIMSTAPASRGTYEAGMVADGATVVSTGIE